MSDWARTFEGGEREAAGVARSAKDVDSPYLDGVASTPAFLHITNSS